MNKKIILLGAAVLALQAVPALAEEGQKGRGGHMFAQKDTNGDGVISKDEFLKGAEDRFGKMDKDGDGKVTKEEAKEARAHMKEKMKERRQKRKENHGGAESSE